ncbi:MAG: hypothetical protein JWO77_674 [Ilumatobacteraceae bacterium]|nr:hypothetical protein [Ilumatobacteraceae bacterium]
MSDNEPTGEPTPGWPSPPSQGAGAPPPAGPPPAPTPPGYGPPPGGYPPQPGGYAPPPGAYAPPTAAPPPGYGYGYDGRSGYPVVRDHPQGTMILVLGILSIVVCGLLGPVAWYMGNKAIKEIDANPSAYSNRGNVQAGRIIGIVASCILIFVVVVYGLLAIALIAGGSSS